MCIAHVRTHKHTETRAHIHTWAAIYNELFSPFSPLFKCAIDMICFSFTLFQKFLYLKTIEVHAHQCFGDAEVESIPHQSIFYESIFYDSIHCFVNTDARTRYGHSYT